MSMLVTTSTPMPMSHFLLLFEHKYILSNVVRINRLLSIDDMVFGKNRMCLIQSRVLLFAYVLS